MKRCFLLTLCFIFELHIFVFAGQWEQDNVGRKYKNGYGTYYLSSWYWIDDDNDGVAECYLFDDSGYIYMDCITPDNFYVNSKGQYVIDGIVQKKQVAVTNNDKTSDLHPIAEFEYKALSMSFKQLLDSHITDLSKNLNVALSDKKTNSNDLLNIFNNVKNKIKFDLDNILIQGEDIARRYNAPISQYQTWATEYKDIYSKQITYVNDIMQNYNTEQEFPF